VTRDLGPILAAIDGALADDEFPDAMRWSPEPETVDDARAPFDGETVWVGPDERRDPVTGRPTPYRWGRGVPADLVIVDEPIGTVTRVEETAEGIVVSGELNADGFRLAERLGLVDPDPFGPNYRPVGWRPLTMPEAVGLALQAE
jgi:hypothetical protein